MFGEKIFGLKSAKVEPDSPAEPVSEVVPPAPSSPAPAPSGGTGKVTDADLIKAMDGAVLEFIKILESKELVIVDNKPQPMYSLQEKLRCFEKAESWIARRHKLAPPAQDDAPGIEMMRKLIAEEMDKASRKEMAEVRAMQTKPRGRPPGTTKPLELTVAEQRRKKQLETPADDAGLQALIRKAAGPGRR